MMRSVCDEEPQLHDLQSSYNQNAYINKQCKYQWFCLDYFVNLFDQGLALAVKNLVYSDYL